MQELLEENIRLKAHLTELTDKYEALRDKYKAERQKRLEECLACKNFYAAQDRVKLDVAVEKTNRLINDLQKTMNYLNITLSGGNK
jgi:hypothetical protein